MKYEHLGHDFYNPFLNQVHKTRMNHRFLDLPDLTLLTSAHPLTDLPCVLEQTELYMKKMDNDTLMVMEEQFETGSFHKVRN